MAAEEFRDTLNIGDRLSEQFGQGAMYLNAIRPSTEDQFGGIVYELLTRILTGESQKQIQEYVNNGFEGAGTMQEALVKIVAIAIFSHVSHIKHNESDDYPQETGEWDTNKFLLSFYEFLKNNPGIYDMEKEVPVLTSVLIPMCIRQIPASEDVWIDPTTVIKAANRIGIFAKPEIEG